MNVAVVDYGAGNIASIVNALYMAGADAVKVSTPEDVLAAERLVLPGVGAAGLAMANLTKNGLDEALREVVRTKGRPMLGICLGMQLIASALHEFCERPGLAWVDADVTDLHDVEGVLRRIPHTGWNSVEARAVAQELFKGIKDGADFYFNHSFTLRPTDDSIVAATCNYGTPLVAALQMDTVFATQFHPEKSQLNGDKLISNFMRWNP
ncbi:imidazole glycerol phosphate synthase subunit HisH [Magnetovibrio sp. PR-2]|uniref:imidazole glycerol phosphate synthase subunit HisH n=1 Tax=Magnetovibrio sp. PR-2 TaxID=3120356 RepID=UPI002FCE3DF8